MEQLSAAAGVWPITALQKIFQEKRNQLVF